MALVEDQMVKVRWNGNNRLYYESLGYKYTNTNDEIEVHISKLPLKSNAEVQVICDYCESLFQRSYAQITKRESKKYCSKSCEERSKNGNGETNEERLNRSITGLQDLYVLNNRVPTVDEYDAYAKENNLIKRRNLESRLGLKYNDICLTYLGDANQISKSKEQLTLELTELKNKLGRSPMAKELQEHGLSEMKQYMRVFDMTYSEIIEHLGWELSSPKLKYKTEEELLDDYSKLYIELGRMPLREDIESCDFTASYSTYRKYFGSLFEVCKILDIDYTKYLSDIELGSGFTCIDSNGDICRSYPEMIITNILIENNIKYIKEYKYNNFIPSYNGNTRMDWYLPTYNVGVEYFGLFDEKYIGSDCRLGKYTERTLQKIRDCRLNNIDLIEIYPKDINEDFEVFIEKFNDYGIKLIA